MSARARRRVTHRRSRPARRAAERSRARSPTADKIAFVDRLTRRRPAGRSKSRRSCSPKWVPQMADAGGGVRRHHAPARRRATPRWCRTSPGSSARIAARRRRGRDLRRRVGDVQPPQHQPDDRRVARRPTAPSATARARARPARPRLPVDRVRLPVRRRRRPGSASPTSPRALLEMGVFEVAVSDTIGVAHPGQVPRVLDAVAARVPLERDRAALPRHARHGARQRAGGAAISASRPSTRRPAGSAAVPTRRARPATSRPRI